MKKNKAVYKRKRRKRMKEKEKEGEGDHLLHPPFLPLIRILLDLE
jgi:hypothetical protein